jgi:hypothetical protein
MWLRRRDMGYAKRKKWTNEGPSLKKYIYYMDT